MANSMTKIRYSLPVIEHAIRDVCSLLEDRSFASWEQYSEDDLWRELVYCILGSRVRFEVVHAAIERMDELCLLSESPRNAHFDRYEEDTVTALSKGYPFYRVRARQIRRAAEHVYTSRRSISDLLKRASDARSVRRILTAEVAGLGPKQASLFLRNIGFAKRIAVLDVHILTYLRWIGLIDSPLKSVPTMGKYEALEDAFLQHSYSFGIPPDQFDLGVWVVMKVAKEESGKWGL